jgi:hypothetical protein
VAALEFNRDGLEEARKGCAAYSGGWCTVNVPLWEGNVKNAEQRLAECRKRQAQEATPTPQATPAPSVVVDLKDALDAGLRIPVLIEGGNLGEGLWGQGQLTSAEAIEKYVQEKNKRLDRDRAQMKKTEEEIARLRAKLLRYEEEGGTQIEKWRAELQSQRESWREEGNQSLVGMVSDVTDLLLSAKGTTAAKEGAKKLIARLSPKQVEKIAKSANLGQDLWNAYGEEAKLGLITQYLETKSQQGGLQNLDVEDKLLLSEWVSTAFTMAGGVAALSGATATATTLGAVGAGVGIGTAAGMLITNAGVTAFSSWNMKNLEHQQKQIDDLNLMRQTRISAVKSEIRAQEERASLLDSRMQYQKDQLRRAEGLLAEVGR